MSALLEIPDRSNASLSPSPGMRHWVSTSRSRSPRVAQVCLADEDEFLSCDDDEEIAPTQAERSTNVSECETPTIHIKHSTREADGCREIGGPCGGSVDSSTSSTLVCGANPESYDRCLEVEPDKRRSSRQVQVDDPPDVAGVEVETTGYHKVGGAIVSAGLDAASTVGFGSAFTDLHGLCGFERDTESQANGSFTDNPEAHCVVKRENLSSVLGEEHTNSFNDKHFDVQSPSAEESGRGMSPCDVDETNFTSASKNFAPQGSENASLLTDSCRNDQHDGHNDSEIDYSRKEENPEIDYSRKEENPCNGLSGHRAVDENEHNVGTSGAVSSSVLRSATAFDFSPQCQSFQTCENPSSSTPASPCDSPGVFFSCCTSLSDIRDDTYSGRSGQKSLAVPAPQAITQPHTTPKRGVEAQAQQSLVKGVKHQTALGKQRSRNSRRYREQQGSTDTSDQVEKSKGGRPQHPEQKQTSRAIPKTSEGAVDGAPFGSCPRAPLSQRRDARKSLAPLAISQTSPARRAKSASPIPTRIPRPVVRERVVKRAPSGPTLPSERRRVDTPKRVASCPEGVTTFRDWSKSKSALKNPPHTDTQSRSKFVSGRGGTAWVVPVTSEHINTSPVKIREDSYNTYARNTFSSTSKRRNKVYQRGSMSQRKVSDVQTSAVIKRKLLEASNWYYPTPPSSCPPHSPVSFPSVGSSPIVLVNQQSEENFFFPKASINESPQTDQHIFPKEAKEVESHTSEISASVSDRNTLMTSDGEVSEFNLTERKRLELASSSSRKRTQKSVTTEESKNKQPTSWTGDAQPSSRSGTDKRDKQPSLWSGIGNGDKNSSSWSVTDNRDKQPSSWSGTDNGDKQPSSWNVIDNGDKQLSSWNVTDHRDKQPSLWSGASNGDKQPSSWSDTDNGDKQPSSWRGSDNGDKQPSSWNVIDNGDKLPSSWRGSDNGDKQPSSWNVTDNEDKQPSSWSGTDNGDKQPSSYSGASNGGKQPSSWSGTDNGDKQPSSWNLIDNGDKLPSSWGNSDNGDKQPSSWNGTAKRDKLPSLWSGPSIRDKQLSSWSGINNGDKQPPFWTGPDNGDKQPSSWSGTGNRDKQPSLWSGIDRNEQPSSWSVSDRDKQLSLCSGTDIREKLSSYSDSDKFLCIAYQFPDDHHSLYNYPDSLQPYSLDYVTSNVQPPSLDSLASRFQNTVSVHDKVPTLDSLASHFQPYSLDSLMVNSSQLESSNSCRRLTSTYPLPPNSEQQNVCLADSTYGSLPLTADSIMDSLSSPSSLPISYASTNPGKDELNLCSCDAVPGQESESEDSLEDYNWIDMSGVGETNKFARRLRQRMVYKVQIPCGLPASMVEVKQLSFLCSNVVDRGLGTPPPPLFFCL